MGSCSTGTAVVGDKLCTARAAGEARRDVAMSDESPVPSPPAKPDGAAPEQVSVPTRPDQAQRASDADRERTLTLLREATVDGRLTLEELAERVELTLHTRTHAELEPITADLGPASPVTAPAGQPTRLRAICSRLERRGRWELAAETHVSAVAATVLLDLRRAVVASLETVLHVNNLFGTVTIVVPEGVRVRVDSGGLFASHEVLLSEDEAPAEAPLLRIRSAGVGGTLYLRTAAPESEPSRTS
jgi:hypothetical protein